MKLEIPAYVRVLMDRLNESGYECYVVGGAVRSLLLGLPVHDYDLTTNALPDQMQQVFAHDKTITTGLKHGTLTVISQHLPVEITTYRKDSTYQDHRHPDAVHFTTAIEEDCARRDFTVNAFCYNDTTGILDFYHGTEDIETKTLRCIGDPDQRFQEDALRILRALRFAAQLHFTIEPNTKQAIFNQKDLLSYISMERIHEEMNGLLGADTCGAYIDTYRNVIAVYLPEINDIKDWHAVIQALDHTRDPVVRAAILLDQLNDPKHILRHLKYANKDIDQITALINNQSTSLNDRIEMRLFLSTYPYDFDRYVSYRSAKDPSFPEERMLACYREVIDDHDCISLSQLALNGKDIQSLGYQGADISRILHLLLQAVMHDTVPNTKEELFQYIREG